MPLAGTMTVYSSPLPGSGAILNFILAICRQFSLNPQDADDVLTSHRVLEALKWGYSRQFAIADRMDPAVSQNNNLRTVMATYIQYLYRFIH